VEESVVAAGVEESVVAAGVEESETAGCLVSVTVAFVAAATALVKFPVSLLAIF